MSDLIGAWGPQIIALVQRHPAQILSGLALAIVVLHWAFSAKGSYGFGGSGGDIDFSGDGGDSGD
jgi:hypothetical protein